MANVDESGFAVDVANLERGYLGDAQAGSVGGHDDHAVFERLDLVEQRLHVIANDDGRELLDLLVAGVPFIQQAVAAPNGNRSADGRGVDRR
jgi:hypothetical protein